MRATITRVQAMPGTRSLLLLSRGQSVKGLQLFLHSMTRQAVTDVTSRPLLSARSNVIFGDAPFRHVATLSATASSPSASTASIDASSSPQGSVAIQIQPLGSHKPTAGLFIPKIHGVLLESSRNSNSNHPKGTKFTTSTSRTNVGTWGNKATKGRASVLPGTTITQTLVQPLTFPPPTLTATEGPDSLPYLDFRTNDSREVFYTKCDEEADNWLKSTTSRMWALDAEWKPFASHGKPGRVSLIQLGNDKSIFLFHVHHMKKFPQELIRILEDRLVLKVGINIRNDGTKIMRDWGVGCKNLVELGALSIQVMDDLDNRRKIRSMERLANELLGHAVEKVSAMRMGNWESKSLSSLQLAYAANDAFVTYEVAERIKELQRMRPMLDYVIPLTTIERDSATVITVRGTLQEREDTPASAKDIVDNEKIKVVATTTTAEATENSVSTKVPSPKRAMASTSAVKVIPKTVSASSRLARKTALRAGHAVHGAPATSSHSHSSAKKGLNPITSKKMQSPSIFTPNPLREDNDLHGLHRKAAETRQAIQHGSRSVTIVLRVNQHPKRPFSTSQSPPLDDAALGNSKDHDDDTKESKQKSHRTGDIYVPASILPASLAEMDTLERNQAIWQVAGGRDLSEDDTTSRVEDDDWYLRQNQALFESLATKE